MSILVVAATKYELAPFLDEYPMAEYLITGVGAPISMYHLSEKTNQKKYDLIIQVGVSGTYSNKFTLGEAVVVEKDCFADLAVIENKILKSVFDLGLADENEFPFKEGWLLNQSDLIQYKNKTSALTVNLLSDESAHINHLLQKYDADIESMEGAVLHYIGLKKNISFLQIRGISNQVGERDKTKWKMTEAIESSNRLLINFYKEYLSKNSQ
jgi:futalosine hydrolase